MPIKHNIRDLEKRVHALSDSLVYLSKIGDFKRLILILRRPGWTTPAEFLLVSAIVDSMRAHVKALADLRGDLLKGSNAVRNIPGRR